MAPLISDPFARKSTENRENYEAILKCSQARYPDTALPDIVNFDNNEYIFKEKLSSSIDRKIKSKEPIPFDQLHINAVHQRYVSADEMKFLILVHKHISRGTSVQVRSRCERYFRKRFGTLSVLRFK